MYLGVCADSRDVLMSRCGQTMSEDVRTLSDVGNLNLKDSYTEEEREEVIAEELEKMRATYPPIEIELRDPKTGMIWGYQFVYYRNSFLLTQLQYYPYIQHAVISVFALIAYLIFSYSRTAEQKRIGSDWHHRDCFRKCICSFVCDVHVSVSMF